MWALWCAAAAIWIGSLDPAEGRWQAALTSPGGELSFGLELARDGGAWRATLINGAERIEVPQVHVADGRIVLAMPHYDSEIRAEVSPGGRGLAGTWVKRSAADQWTRLPFAARAADAIDRADAARHTARFVGRWSVVFSGSDDPAVAVFAEDGAGALRGTFLTTTGDYRFLAGTADADEMRLSCFDGAHAFLFRARLNENGTLAGQFWSRDNWHETWTAKRDPDAQLPDPFALTTWKEETDLGRIRFRDLDGRWVTLADRQFAGKVRIVQVFGSWCPNCHDAAKYLAELHRRFQARGLAIVGLAFELTGNFDRDAEQVRRYAARHGTAYPLLVAGLADKQEASRQFPALDRVRAYPTTIFMDAEGRVRAIHTGFSGPATGDDHAQLRRRFESLLEQLLAE